MGLGSLVGKASLTGTAQGPATSVEEHHTPLQLARSTSRPLAYPRVDASHGGVSDQQVLTGHGVRRAKSHREVDHSEEVADTQPVGQASLREEGQLSNSMGSMPELLLLHIPTSHSGILPQNVKSGLCTELEQSANSNSGKVHQRSSAQHIKITLTVIKLRVRLYF